MRTLPFSVWITASYEPSGSMVSGGGPLYALSSVCSSSAVSVAAALSSGVPVAPAESPVSSAEPSDAASVVSSSAAVVGSGVCVAGVGPVGPAWPPPKKTAPRLTTSTTMPMA